MSLSERTPRGRCLARSGRWQTPSDPRQLLARTNRRQHDRVGVAESVAPTRADSSAKYRRTLADRFRQQQRNFFEQATHSSTDSTERRRSNNNRRSGFEIPRSEERRVGKKRESGRTTEYVEEQ